MLYLQHVATMIWNGAIWKQERESAKLAHPIGRCLAVEAFSKFLMEFLDSHLVQIPAAW